MRTGRVCLGLGPLGALLTALALPPCAVLAQDAAAGLRPHSAPAAAEPDPGASEPIAQAEDRFVGGASAQIDREVSGDAFAAGREVRLRAAVEGDAVLAGAEVSIEADVDDDLYAAGGSVELQAAVEENARLAGGSVRIGPRGAVLGRATVAAAQAQVAGRIGHSAAIYADRVQIDGEIGGDLLVAARTLRIGPGAQIGGRLFYRGATPADISSAAVIAGGVEYTPTDLPEGVFGSATRAATWLGAVLLVASLLLVGALLVLVAPAFSAQAAATVASNPIRSLALGFALAVSVPAAGLVAMASVIGIPLGLLLLLCYPVLLLLGAMTVALFIGDRIAAAVRRAPARAGAGLRLTGLGLALVLLVLLAAIPHVGVFLLLAAICLGLGAWALRTWRAYLGAAPSPRSASAHTQGEPA